MSAKMGRPTDNPKTAQLTVRLSNDTLEKLNYLTEIEKCLKSDIVRKGIEIQYEQSKEK